MDLGCEILNDLISKNNSTAMAAAQRIVDNCDIESYMKLCEKSEFLFDFIKEKINENLFKAVNSSNINNTFEFTKVYNPDFEDFIIKSWVKYADEDLTDKILEIFENGKNEQKTYAAGYFYYINDSLAIEYLEKYAFCDFEPLAQNSARALSRFDNKDIYNKALNIINSEADDFDKYKYVNFLVSYGQKEAYPVLYNYFTNSYAKSFIASNILYLKSFDEIIQDNEIYQAFKIFDVILTAYPEEISLDTVFDFEIFKLIKFLNKKINDTYDKDISYIKRLLLKAKYKFNLISKEDIYTYDLDKNVKKEINAISGFLNTIETDLYKGIEQEFAACDKERVLETFDVILNSGRKEFSPAIKDVINTTEYEDVIAEGIRVLKSFNDLYDIKKDEILKKIKNENIKAIISNAFD